MTISDVYKLYNDYVRPIYCEIEARDNILPVELLFEIHAAFNHLTRFYLDDQEEAKACEKAISHLQRGVLDAFKLKLKYFNDDVKRLKSRKIDFNIIDSGKYITSFIKSKNNIISHAKEARLSESKQGKGDAFEKWINVSLLINDFYKEYFDETKLNWARIKTFKLFSMLFILGIITGLISSGIIAYICDFMACH